MTDRFQLHLMAGALNERHRGINGVTELHLLAIRVIEEPRAAVAHQIADRKHHFECVAAESGLVAAEHDVTLTNLVAHPAKLSAAEKIIACAVVVYVFDPLRPIESDFAAGQVRGSKSTATVALYIETKLLMPLIGV